MKKQFKKTVKTLEKKSYKKWTFNLDLCVLFLLDIFIHSNYSLFRRITTTRINIYILNSFIELDIQIDRGIQMS